jgi:hypothetical protein
VKAQPLLEQIAEKLEIPPGAEVVGGVVFESLADLLENGVDDPEFLVDDVLYDGDHVHLVSAHPGAGKTSWVMQLAWLVMAQERDVVWFDYEGGKKPTVRRLLDVGVPIELVRERFHYAGWPTDGEKHLAAIAKHWAQPPLVVVDSFSKALSFAGISENANDEVTTWTVQVVRACKQNGLPIVIIDHVPKDAKSSMYSRGAGAKLADVDVHWGLTTEQPFNRKQAGSISVHQHKDRPGFFPFTTWWSMGDGQGNLTIAPMDSPPDPDNPDNPDSPDL